MFGYMESDDAIDAIRDAIKAVNDNAPKADQLTAFVKAVDGLASLLGEASPGEENMPGTEAVQAAFKALCCLHFVVDDEALRLRRDH